MFDRIFITGIYGSGKTTLARSMTKDTKRAFVDYDDMHTYSTKCDFNKVMKRLGSYSNFAIDAIPISVDDGVMGWKKFRKWEDNNKCSIVCCYTPDINIWLERWAKKKHWIGHPSGDQVNEWKKHYKDFYTLNVHELYKLRNVPKCWDSISNEYTSMEIMKGRLTL